MAEEAHTDPDLTPDTPNTEVDTPAPEGETPDTPHIDWEKRYNDLRSFSDRRFQEVQEELQTYEQRLAANEAPPVVPQAPVAGDDDDLDWYDDPLQHPALAAAVERLNRVEAQLQQKLEQESVTEQAAKEETYIDGELTRLEKTYKDKLSDEEASMVGNFALSHRDEHGNPDVELAYVTYRKSLEGRKSQWVETKRSAAAPGTGPGAIEVPENATRQQRLDYINQRIAAIEAAEGN